MIVVNFKTYPEATGEKAVKLAKICEEVAKKYKLEIVVGLQAADIFRLRYESQITIFGQHCEPLEPGRNTGWTTALALKKAGAAGVFLNHSEHPYPPNFSELEKAVKVAKQIDLKTLVFAKDLEASLRIDKFGPDYIALEEPTMVSGDLAMAKVPKFKQMIKDFSHRISSIPLIGAGIKTHDDVLESLKLGAKGIALASGFIKSDNPKLVLESFASAF